MRTVAALYVQDGGSYYNLPGVVPFNENDDARMYHGPHPIVAHPPCQRWGKMWKGQPGNIKRGKVEKLGDDGGCFKSALFDVRRFGGVLEHPEHSNAWRLFGLAKADGSGQMLTAGRVALSKGNTAITAPNLHGSMPLALTNCQSCVGVFTL